MFGDLGLKKLVADVIHLRRAGWDANKSCGLHCHIDASDFDADDHRAIFRFAKWYEDEIFALLPLSRRSNQYCKRLGGRISQRDRYVWTNFCALKEFGTIEIRAAAGTFHPIRVRQWVALMLAFMETAIRLGRQRSKPRVDLFGVLKLGPRDIAYWTARKNRFIRDQQERERQIQTPNMQATTQPAPAGG